MNKRVIIFWAIILHFIVSIIFLIISGIVYPIVLRDLLFWYFIFSFVPIFFVMYILFISYLCAPKYKLPPKISIYNYENNIHCEIVKHSIFELKLSEGKIKLDMRGWIFKKWYVRDIVLMYYHLYYYNKYEMLQSKGYKKNYFSGKTISIVFNNGKKSKSLFLVKNGKEKRTIICSLKLFIYFSPIMNMSKGSTYKNRHIHCDIYSFYR